MDSDRLFNLLETIAAEIPAVESVERSSLPDAPEREEAVQLTVRDFIPGEEQEPWFLVGVYTQSFKHPLYEDSYDCIELSLGLAQLGIDDEDYGSAAAAYALPFADAQRFCPAASLHWSPEDGHFYIYGQVPVRDQSKPTLIAEVRDVVRSIIGLTYLASFSFWQVQAHKHLPPETKEAIVEEVHERMLAHLGIST